VYDERGLELAAYVSAEVERTIRGAFDGVSSQPVEPGWEDRWRAFHRPVRAGGLWIGPPWETPPAGAPSVVVDPGRAFGTGAHATTRACIELLARLEGLLPGVRGRVAYADVGAPPSTVRFTRNAFGASCGFELNWRNFPFRNPLAHVETPLANFHMAGHFTVWPGTVPTAALSGKIAALRAHERLARVRARTAAPAAAAAPARAHA
jgi:phytoene dehydrogenase-like protein